MFHRYSRHCWHCYVEQYWFKVVLTLFINVIHYRINIISTLCTSNFVYIVHIVDIAMTSLTADNLVYIVHIIDIAMLYDINYGGACWRVNGKVKKTLRRLQRYWHNGKNNDDKYVISISLRCWNIDSTRGTEHEKGNNYTIDDQEVKCHNPFISKSY